MFSFTWCSPSDWPGLSTIRTARAPSSEWRTIGSRVPSGASRSRRSQRCTARKRIRARIHSNAAHAARRRQLRDGPVPIELLRRAERARRGRGGGHRSRRRPDRAAARARAAWDADGRHPRHAHRRRSHRRRRRAGRRHRRRGLGAGRRGRGAPHRRDAWGHARPGARAGAHRHGRRRDHRRRDRLRGDRRSGALRRATSRSTRTASSSPATFCSPGRSAASTSREATGRRCSPRCARCSTAFPRETVVHPGHGPATTLGRELETNPFLRELRDAQRRADASEQRAAGCGRASSRRRAGRTTSCRTTPAGGSSCARWRR